MRVFGTKPDGSINFLSNEAPVKSGSSYRYPEACLGEPHYLNDDGVITGPINIFRLPRRNELDHDHPSP